MASVYEKNYVVGPHTFFPVRSGDTIKRGNTLACDTATLKVYKSDKDIVAVATKDQDYDIVEGVSLTESK